MPVHSSSIPYTQTQQLVRLLRVYNGRLLVLFFLFGHAMAYQSFELRLIWPSLALLLTYGLISISNFLYDQKIDKANAKVNPYQNLPTKLINQFYYLCALMVLICVAFSPQTGATLVVVLTIFGIGYVYSHPRFQFSYRPLPKFVSMSLSYTFLPALLGLYPYLTNSAAVTTTLLFCLMASSWLMYSDIRDIEGDLQHNKRTIANTLGVRKTAVLAALLGTGSYLLLLVTSTGNNYTQLVLALLPLVQWFAVWNRRLLTSRRSLITLNYFWLTILMIWIWELVF